MSTRRDVLRWVCAWAAGPATAATTGAGERVQSAEYTAKATVLLLSLPLIHRDNVGSGYLRVAEREEGGRKHWRLEFGAGSLPERAAGLNRLGVFEERVVEGGSGIESATYFGFMTASNEKNLEQAKAALKQGANEGFTAITGTIGNGKVSNRLLRIGGLKAKGWAEREELTAGIRSRITAPASPVEDSNIAEDRSKPCSTFLYAVSCAMRGESANGLRHFVHNGKIHRLVTERKATKTAGVAEVEGRIQSDDGKDLSRFRLWFETADPSRGPLRFEFRPRSFLRLSFERRA